MNTSRKLSNGLRPGTGKCGNSICVGAGFRRRDTLLADPKAPIKLNLVRLLRWVSYDRDQGGAYWGYKPDGVEVFARSGSRSDANLLAIGDGLYNRCDFHQGERNTRYTYERLICIQYLKNQTIPL